jgi:predicted ester cyclase
MNTEEQNKALVRGAFEQVWKLRKIDKIPDFYSPEFVADYPQLGPPVRGHDGFREWLEGIWSANPDLHEEHYELIAEGDLVVARFTNKGIQRVEWGELPSAERTEAEEIVILKIRQGKIVGQHGVFDLLPAFRALGIVPARS